ncbi:myosin phosphatase Rho-interacting protein-like [Salvelinus fontinalis]|uniref:myosin phosphatase Rho-interacting protein-like n=1 Tax=Salvelinus fontinalis TaxID=8038 RepID=UPI0024856AE0|nr:myosin phosphatase Rho-interacting protein-like [Salvelinus fontinalis]
MANHLLTAAPNFGQQDTAYSTDKLKALYAELRFSRSKVQCDIPKLREELQTATVFSRDEGRSGDGPNAAQMHGRECLQRMRETFGQ